LTFSLKIFLLPIGFYKFGLTIFIPSPFSKKRYLIPVADNKLKISVP
jgi:hypothetical protein